MGCDTGIACGARGKEHKHRIVAAGGILGAVIVGAEALHLYVKVIPAVTLASDKYLEQSGGTLPQPFRLLQRPLRRRYRR